MLRTQHKYRKEMIIDHRTHTENGTISTSLTSKRGLVKGSHRESLGGGIGVGLVCKDKNIGFTR